MKNDILHVKFDNRRNPKSEFDSIQLEKLFQTEDLEASLKQLQVIEFYMIILIQEGYGTHTIDFSEFPYQKGSLLTVRKDQIHKFHSNPTVKGNLLLFTDNFLVSYLEKFENQKTLQLFNESLGHPKIDLTNDELTEINELIDRINAEYLTVKDEYSLHIIRSELHILITKLYRIKSKNKQIINDKKYLKEFIAFQELVENNVTSYSKVHEYANKLHVSTKTLNNITQSVINMPAKTFINDIYIKQIKRLLLNTNLPIKQIAYKAGFEEVSNFYKYFKKQVNSTPEQFRNHYS